MMRKLKALKKRIAEKHKEKPGESEDPDRKTDPKKDQYKKIF